MSEKNEQCSGSVHVWPDDGDTCKCGKRTHADVEREAKREWTILEKLERMASDRLLRSILTTEDCQELMRNRIRATCEHPRWKKLNNHAPWKCEECDMVMPHGFELGCDYAAYEELNALQLDFASFGFPDVEPGERYLSRRLRGGMMKLDEMKKYAPVTATLEARGTLWEDLFMFYLPRCYEVALEAPTEQARLEARVKAAVRMANDAFRIARENRA